RDTYSTNSGPVRMTATGVIASSLVNPLNDPGATDGAIFINNGVNPTIMINSASHGLVTGDRVLISGVLGNTAANGVFNVTVVDPNHFLLNGSTGNGVYAGGGTWTKLVATTRDPMMRVVLPNAANGT